jgi:hypothetical protein
MITRYAFAFAVATVLAACNAGGLLIVEDAGSDAGGSGGSGGSAPMTGCPLSTCPDLPSLNCGFLTCSPARVCGVIFFDAGTFCAPGSTCNGIGECL